MIAIYNNIVTERKMISVLLYIIVILNYIITILRRSSDDVPVNIFKTYRAYMKTFRHPRFTNSVRLINVHVDFENISSTTRHVLL